MLLITIWPIFALICLGFVLVRRGFPSAEFWPAAERINYFILFPSLLISSLAKAPVDDPEILRLGAAAVVTILIGAGVVTILRGFRPMPAARFGPLLQGVVRFNTYLGLSVVATIAGSEGLERAAVYLAITVPLVNLLSIIALSDGPDARAPAALIRTVFRNPLILACLVGLALALAGIGLPFGAGSFFELMGRASLPLGLLCVGAALKPATLRGDLAALASTGIARLMLMPALAAAVGTIFGVSGVEALVLVAFAAIPTAPTAYVLTRQLGGDSTLMAGIVTSQTMAAVLTIPLMLGLLTG